MRSTRTDALASSRGAALLGAVFLTITVGGLAFALLQEGMAARAHVVRETDSFQSLEMAETGAAKIESRIVSLQDLTVETEVVDGATAYVMVGAIVGGIGNGTYDVSVRSQAFAADPEVDTAWQSTRTNWTVKTKGDHRLGQRTLEIGYRRTPNAAFAEGLFSIYDMTVNGTKVTDAYDSRLGTYASQATNYDAENAVYYAQSGGNIGSNEGFIYLNGGSVLIRGDAIPGPDRLVDENGSPTVTGSTDPREYSRELPPTPESEFQAAYAANNIGWTAPDPKNVDWDPIARTLKVKKGTFHFTGGTYFFAEFSVGAGATVYVDAPSRFYVTSEFDVGSGTIVNATISQAPADLAIFAHPYSIPAGTTTTTPVVNMNGGPSSAWVMYGPMADLTIGGNSDYYGGAVARTITLNGTVRYHYDKALDNQFLIGLPRLDRSFWRELSRTNR
jgi:hypothetical protein